MKELALIYLEQARHYHLKAELAIKNSDPQYLIEDRLAQTQNYIIMAQNQLLKVDNAEDRGDYERY